jgi:hypothetical protein
MVRAEVAPHVSDPASLDPIGLRRSVWQAVADVAEMTDCLHKGRTLSLVALEPRYCPEGLRRVTAIAIQDTSGQWCGGLPVYAQHDMDRRFPEWRSTPASDDTQAIVSTGPNALIIYPAPLTSRAGALRIEGFYKPGESWVFDTNGAPVAPARADECPLPSFAQSAAVERAKWIFAKSLLVKNPAIAPVLEVLRAESLRLIGNAEADAATHWQAVRRGR